MNLITRLLRFSLPLAFIFSVSIYAAPGLKSNSSLTNSSTGQYETQIEDIRVKVQGGYLIIARSYKNGEWHWNRRWNPITLIGLDRYDPASLPTKVNRNGALYIPRSGDRNTKDHARMSYWLGNTRSFTVAKDNLNNSYNYTWHNKQGSSIRYAGPLFDADLDARDYQPKLKIASYSDINGNTITFNRNGLGDIETISMADVTLLTYTYNANRLQYITDYSGRRVEYHYTNGKLTAVRDVRGEVWKYGYQADTGYLNSYSDPEGFTATLDVDANGVVSNQSNDNGQQTQTITSYVKSKDQSYRRQTDASGMITETWSNANGQTVRLDINGETRYTVDVILSDNSTNVRKLNKGDGLYVKTRIRTDAQGDKTRTDYDRWGNITKIVYPDGGTEERHYDLRFMLLDRLTDETGVISEHSHDDKGNLIQMVEAKGLPEERTIQYSYDSHGNQIEIKRLGDDNTQEIIETYTYDNYGNLKTQTNGEGNLTQYAEYDVLGNVKNRIDGRGNAWQRGYDEIGNLTSETDPDNRSLKYEYNKRGQRSKIVEPDGTETIYNYHGRQLTSIVNPAIKGIPAENSPEGYVRAFDYDEVGRLAKTTDANGNSIQTNYDNEGRIKQQVDGNNNIISYDYKDNQLSQINYPTFSEAYLYNDREDRTSSTIYADARVRQRQILNDRDARIITQIDRNNNLTTQQYDVFGRLIKTVNAEQGETYYKYDNRDNLIEVIDPEGRSTIFTYDKANRLTNEIKQNNNETTGYIFDEAGSLTTIISPTQNKIIFEYSYAGLLVEVKWYQHQYDNITEKIISYTYTENGHLESYTDENSSASYTYNARGQLTQITQDFSTFTKSYRYSYYPNGQKKSYTNPEGIEYSYSYDNNGQLQAIDIPNEGQLRYNNYKWTAPTEIIYPKGNKQLLDYDDTLRRVSQIYQDIARLDQQSTTLSYDNENNITSQTKAHAQRYAQGTTDYSYDNNYRLTEVDTTTTNSTVINPTLILPEDERYSYDKVANRITSHSTEQDWQYNDNNQLIQADTISYSYDKNGNRITKTDTQTNHTTHYIYNSEQRLIRLEQEDNTSQIKTTLAHYSYDPFGRRISKTISNQTTYYLYSQEGLIAEYDATGTLKTEYHYQPDSTWMTNPLFMRTDGNQQNPNEILYYVNDHLGTPQALRDKGGQLHWLANYSAFGEADIQTLQQPQYQVTQNLRFPGQYYDEESGLHQNYFRDYEPETGRYIEADPIGLSGGVNIFGYVGGNPVIYSDQRGLYFPEQWPDNCILTIYADNSYEERKEIIGSPRLLGKKVIWAPVQALKKWKVGYIAKLYWEKVTYNFLFKVKDLSYYLECEEIDECGNVTYNLHPAHHHEEVQETLPDTIEKWVEYQFGHEDVPDRRKK